MPIHRRSVIQSHLDRLEKAVAELKAEMIDNIPQSEIHELYSHSISDFERDFRHINPDELGHKIDQVRSALTLINKLQKPVKHSRLHRSD